MKISATLIYENKAFEFNELFYLYQHVGHFYSDVMMILFTIVPQKIVVIFFS